MIFFSHNKLAYASLILFIFLTAMDGGTRRSTYPLEPTFAQLEDDAKSLKATIYDDESITEVYDISFYGHLHIGGIRKETDDSLTKLELENIKELTIAQGLYNSKRFQDREFSLVNIITKHNVVVEQLLVPRHIIICGIDQKSHMEKSWFLSKIDRLTIDGEHFPKDLPENVIDKAYEKIKKNKKKKLYQTRSISRSEKRSKHIRSSNVTQETPATTQEKKGVYNALKDLGGAVKEVAVETTQAVKDLFN